MDLQCKSAALAAACALVVFGCGDNSAYDDRKIDGSPGTYAPVAGSSAAPVGGAAGVGGDPQAGAGGSLSPGASDGGSAGRPSTEGRPLTPNGFVNLAPALGEPLDPAAGTPLSPPPPEGWVWYEIPGALCRDGSATGFYVRFTQSDKLLMYLEGGGACTSPGFCNYNPKNVNESLSGDGQSVIGSSFGAQAVRQQPGAFEMGSLHGIFDATQDANPFKDWNQIYVPYCTGDVHAGTNTDVMVPGVAEPQQFVGYLNMEKFIARIVPTFRDSVNQVILTGASAGGFGTALNLSRLQDAFGEVPVDGIDDSGPPFADEYMPVCMQKKWRDLFGLDAVFPPDCDSCFNADGGGMLNLADFLMEKHPDMSLALISSMHDEVIRLFFSSGLKNCANADTADPLQITLGQFDPEVYYPAERYAAGLNDLRARFESTGRFATYFIGGSSVTYHQHVWRPRFFEAPTADQTIAVFATNFVAGQMGVLGP